MDVKSAAVQYTSVQQDTFLVGYLEHLELITLNSVAKASLRTVWLPVLKLISESLKSIVCNRAMLENDSVKSF